MQIHLIALFAFACNTYLLANWFVSVDREVKYHKVTGVYYDEGQEYLGLENGAYADHPKLRNVRRQAFNGRSEAGLAAFHFRRGCMGMLVLEYIEFIEPETDDEAIKKTGLN